MLQPGEIALDFRPMAKLQGRQGNDYNYRQAEDPVLFPIKVLVLFFELLHKKFQE